MKARQAAATGGFAATAGVFLGLAAAIAVVLIGAAWIATRARRPPPQVQAGPVSVATPARRGAP